MDGGATTATLQSPALQRYRRWMRSLSPDLAGVSEVACLEKPTTDFIARLAAARAADVPRLICGFLPDEVEWPAVGWNEDMAFFVARMEFRPLRFSAPAAVADSSSGPYVVVTELPSGTISGAESVTVAAACAQAASRELITIDALTTDDDEIAAAVAIASVVFNDTAGWSVGFAVDELAARLGRHCVRLRPATYSPLRYAFLHYALPRTAPEGVPRLRPLIAGIIGRTARPPAAIATDAFDPAVAPELWGRLVRSKTFALFTDGGVWAHAAKTGGHDVRRWLNRATSWALLAAAGKDPEFPRATWDLAVRTITTWLFEEQGIHLRGKVRTCALMRWVRLFPEWLDRYREVAGESDESRGVVALWVGGGLDWRRCDASVGSLLTHARWAIDTAVGEHHPWALLRAWRDDWSAVPAAAEGWPSLSPLWREACADAAVTHLESNPLEPTSVLERLSAANLWMFSCGPAGAVIGLLAGLRLRRRNYACRAWRELAVANHCGSTGGFAAIVRSALGRVEDLRAWLHFVALDRVGTSPATLLWWRWHTARAADLWRADQPVEVQRELRAALRWFDARLRTTGRFTEAGLHILLLALDRRHDDLNELVARMSSGGRPLGQWAGVVALACWSRGAPARAGALVEANPAADNDSAWALFLRAVVHQLLGQVLLANVAVQKLVRLAPRYLTEPAVDARWIWAAVCLKQAGQIELAEAMRCRAIAVDFDLPPLIASVTPSAQPLADGWGPLLAGHRPGA